MYPSNIKELQLINCVAQDYFNKYDRADIIGNVDFAIKMKRRSQGSKHEEFISQDMDDIYFLWAEAKVAENACEEMLTQLILSAKDAMNRHNCLPPYYLGCFDHKKIAFAPYEDILPLLQDTNNELDWNTPRSDYANSRFKHAVSIIKRRNALRNMAVYHFHQSGDDQNLRLFIAQNFTCGSGGALLKRPITVHDFASIYQNEWKPKVLPSINLSDREWKEYAKNDIHGGDFFLAELMSEHGSAIDLTAKLAVKMVDGKYKEVKTIAGKQYTLDDGITHKNGGTEYERFWNKYQRPPAPSQCEQIIARRDLLLPDEYRERQGAFYTPAKWVRLAHQYIERALGSDWQQRYYIWDCAAGTGNLLCGLKYKDQIFASTLHQADVQVMKAIIREQNSACNMQHDESRKQNAESRVQQSESRRQNTNPSTTTNCIAREHSFGAAQQFSMATEHSAVVSEEIYGATEHSFGVSEELSMASEHSVGLSQEFSMASEHSVGMPQEFSTASEHSVGEAQELSNATDSTEHKTMSKNILPLLEGNVFEFDFLNDPLDDPKIPHLLRQILHNKGTLNGKQLLILINPPYAEHGNRRMVSNPTERNKSEVATAHKLHDSLAKKIGGQAARELFAMFLARIKDEIPLAALAQFSILKFVNAPHFVEFRNFFKCRYLGGFIVPADSFDVNKGRFPIGFMIWDLQYETPITEIECDIYGKKGEQLGRRKFFSCTKVNINTWIRNYYDRASPCMGYLNCHTPDFSHQNYIWISNNPEINTARPVTCGNMKYMCIYFAVRHCVAATWINDRDQFLYPRDGWQQDEEFGMDCLVFALFHGQNRFSAAGMTARSGAEQNHWLPFRASEVGAAAAYQSMAADMLQAAEHALSAKAQAVLAAGMELYKYYHQQSGALLLAGFYDIRLHFQGKNGSKMNHSSADQEYMHRIAALRAANKQLAASIELKVYQYGFLKN